MPDVCVISKPGCVCFHLCMFVLIKFDLPKEERGSHVAVRTSCSAVRAQKRPGDWLAASQTHCFLSCFFFLHLNVSIKCVQSTFMHDGYVSFFMQFFPKKKKKNHKNHLFFHNCQSLKCFFFFNLHLNLFTFILYKCFHCSNLPTEDQKTPPKTCESLFFFSLATIIV